MSTQETQENFNLSLAHEQKAAEEAEKLKQLQANPNLEQTVDPDTGEKKLVTHTDSGIDINKGKAPALVLQGPLGHMYTEELNRVLTKENLVATTQAYKQSEQARVGSPSQNPTGYIETSDQGATVELDVDGDGYLYVVDGETLTADGMMRATTAILDQQRQFPDKVVSLGLSAKGKLSHNAESLLNCMVKAGVKVAVSHSGIRDLGLAVARGQIKRKN